MLERVYYWGQNDFCPVRGMRSVSVGDVVGLGGRFYMVRPLGFGEIPEAELVAYKGLPMEERHFSEFVCGK